MRASAFSPLSLGILLVLCLFSTPAFPAEAPAQKAEALSPEQSFSLVAGEAEKGNAMAMLTMGRFFEQGVGVGRNFIKAREWYQKAADAGLPQGMYNVAMCYEIGIGSDGDMAKALEYYEKAAEKSLPEAMLRLSILYDQGAGVPQDAAKALEYLKKAASAGNAEASTLMGVVYLRGLGGYQKNGGKAIDLFVQAAEKGNVEAMKNLAVVFKDGIEYKPSAIKAYKWYCIAKACGFHADDLEATMEELRSGMSAEQVRQAEREAAEWLAAMQKKMPDVFGALQAH